MADAGQRHGLGALDPAGQRQRRLHRRHHVALTDHEQRLAGHARGRGLAALIGIAGAEIDIQHAGGLMLEHAEPTLDHPHAGHAVAAELRAPPEAPGIDQIEREMVMRGRAL